MHFTIQCLLDAGIDTNLLLFNVYHALTIIIILQILSNSLQYIINLHRGPNDVSVCFINRMSHSDAIMC